MTSVAGDFYEFVLTEGDCAGLLIADVSGHGVPAALIASMVKLAAASQKQNAADPAAFLSGMNAALCGNTQSQFVTAAYAYLDSRSRRLTYSAAGHPPVLLVRDGSATAVEENGFMLAAFDSATYSNRVVELRPKDRVLLYTDGVLEACNSAGEFFGAERLTEAILHASALSVDAAAEKIVQEVKQWSRVQEDDITLLLCEFVDQG
jgi:sigma-B regulation protein RsbU (phosphoserine phosphatase)